MKMPKTEKLFKINDYTKHMMVTFMAGYFVKRGYKLSFIWQESAFFLVNL